MYKALCERRARRRYKSPTACPRIQGLVHPCEYVVGTGQPIAMEFVKPVTRPVVGDQSAPSFAVGEGNAGAQNSIEPGRLQHVHAIGYYYFQWSYVICQARC